jgi:hypothetical protein
MAPPFREEPALCDFSPHDSLRPGNRAPSSCGHGKSLHQARRVDKKKFRSPCRSPGGDRPDYKTEENMMRVRGSLPGGDQQQRDGSQLFNAEQIWVYYHHSNMKW